MSKIKKTGILLIGGLTVVGGAVSSAVAAPAPASTGQSTVSVTVNPAIDLQVTDITIPSFDQYLSPANPVGVQNSGSIDATWCVAPLQGTQVKLTLNGTTDPLDPLGSAVGILTNADGDTMKYQLIPEPQNFGSQALYLNGDDNIFSRTYSGLTTTGDCNTAGGQFDINFQFTTEALQAAGTYTDTINVTAAPYIPIPQT